MTVSVFCICVLDLLLTWPCGCYVLLARYHGGRPVFVCFTDNETDKSGVVLTTTDQP